ncbi:hypothetical protein DW989_04935, partial [Bacteroides stercoris]
MFKKRKFEELYQCQSIVYKLRCNLEEKYKSEQYRNWFERENIDRFLTIVYNMYTPSDRLPRNKRIDILKTLNLDILAATKPTIVYNMYTPSDRLPRNKRIDILKTLNLDILAATKPT